ncbi:FAD-dependent oxidoreductase [Amycolatopsis pithecellobii]|uniref:FAD-dependent oxidoreductase n=1 Tax=Amycolatopsis pithecellobii TaxID=664692 RepID=A0A6N7YKU1_9PSEU|nr:FAD-dependent oxidoreductase [Amycolatopsis pithecellobii]MTD53517.1 FAD-dependent oxidoreductase [Amycolatopsis pithecellobii]
MTYAGPASTSAGVVFDEPAKTFDIIVVGAGPAGSAAALEAARAGRSVALIERGPFPGAKNVYGGVVYGRILDELVPDWWEHMPVQRWVTRRSTMVMTPTQALTVDFRTQDWGRAPYNGATAYRADLDSWLAEQAVAAGAVLIPSTVVTNLLQDRTGTIVGVRTDRPDGDLTASVVIACDGVNSFLAKEAGLYQTEHQAEHLTLGVKQTLALPRHVIEERFAITGRDGVDIEMLGCTRGIPGGGFLYTNLDSVSIGVVLALTGVSKAKTRPEELVAELKRHPAIAPLIRGGEQIEYSAHLIPEGGYDAMPELIGDGMLVAGDAAAMCLAAGIWLEGVNFAIGAGMYAGRAAAAAVASGDVSRRGLAGYRTMLEKSFVLADHRKLRKFPGLVLSDRTQQQYPALVCDLVQGMFQVDNPAPKPGLRKLLRRSMKENGVRWRELLRDGWTGMRGLR